jgi:tripartite-type tricarboxylate transporter receptor subunit TctC
MLRIALVVLAAAVLPALAQDRYPSRPVRIVVPYQPGGATDIIARIVAVPLSETLGQSFIVENRPGASGNLALESVAKAPADGYTLLIGNVSTNAINESSFAHQLSIRPSRDLTGITKLVEIPHIIAATAGFPGNSVADLVAAAKKDPGKINFGSAGQGSTGQLATELLKLMAGINMTHVPYKGAGPSLIGLVSREIELMISGLASGLPYIKQKQVRALAVTSLKRVPQLPDVPPVADTVPGYEAGSWYAVLTRAGTPRPIVERLNREAAAAVRSADVNAKLVSSGVDPDPLTPEALGAKIRAETARWAKVVKAIGLQPN